MRLDSIASRIPSLQDLVSAIAMFQIGKPSVIYPEEGGYIIIKPVKGKTPRVNAEIYDQLVKGAVESGDLDAIVDGLRGMGFDVSGEANGKFGHGDPKLQTQVKQFGSQVPTATGKEVGGVSTRGEGGARATELKRTGTKDHVELEVEYDPQTVQPIEALDDVDDTFVFHTHPKMADNNYFPGKMQKR